MSSFFQTLFMLAVLCIQHQPSDKVGFFVSTNRSKTNATAILSNTSKKDMYLVFTDASPSPPVQRYDRTHWEFVSTKPMAELISPSPVEYVKIQGKQEIRFKIHIRTLEKMNEEPNGQFRFCVRVNTKPSYNGSEMVCSEDFKLLKPSPVRFYYTTYRY